MNRHRLLRVLHKHDRRPPVQPLARGRRRRPKTRRFSVSDRRHCVHPSGPCTSTGMWSEGRPPCCLQPKSDLTTHFKTCINPYNAHTGVTFHESSSRFGGGDHHGYHCRLCHKRPGCITPTIRLFSPPRLIHCCRHRHNSMRLLSRVAVGVCDRV